MYDNIYKKIGLKSCRSNAKFKLNKSIKKFFKISAISSFSPNFSLFSNCNLNEKTFNNSFQIEKLLKKKYKIHNCGYIFKAQLKYKNTRIYKDIFLKECPILDPSELDIDMNLIKNNYENYIIKNTFCNHNSSHNIELLVNYLTSKLTENKVSPSFPKFYGFNSVIMKKFTYDYTDSYSDNIVNYLDNKYYQIYFKKKLNKIYLQRNNFPCLLFYMEKMEEDLFEYCKYRGKITEREWCSYIFQIIAALKVAQDYYGLSHNDLHTCNVMYVSTQKTHLFYKFNNEIFKIPTYGKIIKIIDWGRATYNFNNINGLNSVFKNSGEAFGQFILPGFINGKKYNTPNNSTDLAIFGANLLMDKHFPKTGELFTMVKSWTKYGKNKYLDVTNNSFSLYTKASNYCKNAIPKDNINKKCFQKFKHEKSKFINEWIYEI